MTDSVESAKNNLTFERIVSRIKTASSHIPRLFLELAVVFIGVYLAFLLTDYQEELEKQDIRIKFFEGLIVEFDRVVFHLDKEEVNMLPHLSAMEQISKGNQPQVPVHPLYYPVPGKMVTAAFDSRNFESLNTSTIENIVRAAPHMEELHQKINMFNDFLVVHLTAQESNVTCCYDHEGKLFEHYAWYPELIEEIHYLNRYIRNTIIESAIPDLEELTQ